MTMRMLLVVVSLVLSSCATFDAVNPIKRNPPDSVFESGRVHLGIYPPIGWYAISKRLNPKFGVKSADDLRNDVLPITSTDLTALQELKSLQLTLDLAGTSRSGTNIVTRNTETNDAGQTTTTTESSTRTETQTPGSSSLADASAEPPAGSVSFEGLDLSQVLGLGVDPFLRVRAQTALWQEIQLLNSYLDAEVATTGETPYLFRAQISIQPFARDIPYDVYTELFVKADCDGVDTCEDPKIIPLIVIDNTQRSAERRLANAAQQLETTVSALVSNRGLGFGRNRIRQQLKDLQAYELDTAFMVGQSDEEELTIRAAAAKSPSGYYEIVARTYEVSFLVLWPAKQPLKAHVMAFSSMRNVENGRRIPNLTAAARKRSVEQLVDVVRGRLDEPCIAAFRYALLDNQSKGRFTESECANPKSRDEMLRWFSSSAANGAALAFLGRFGIYDDSEAYQRLRDLFEATKPTRISVALPHQVVRMPPSQTAVLTDNGSTTSSVVVGGSVGLNSATDRLGANLIVDPVKKGQSVSLAALAIEVGINGEVNATFPTVTGTGLLDRTKYKSPRMELYRTPSLTASTGLPARSAKFATVATSDLTSYPVILNERALPKPERLFSVAISPKTAAISGNPPTTSVRVVLETKNCKPTFACPEISDYYLSVQGHPISSVQQNGAAAPSGTFEPAKNSVVLTPGAYYDLSFLNPASGGSVTITVNARNASGKAIGGNQSFMESVTFKGSSKED